VLWEPGEGQFSAHIEASQGAVQLEPDGQLLLEQPRSVQ
jgi:hypothetical protein